MLLGEELKKFISDQNQNGIIKHVIANRNSTIMMDDFINFTTNYNADLVRALKGAFINSGSGGSRIVKPNISSIASLYTAPLINQPVVKIGSKAITSVSGSTDFFESIGFSKISNKLEILSKYNFMYYDVLELAPWKPYENLFKTNKSFKQILENSVYHYYQADTELFGVLGHNKHLDYINKIHINNPNNLITYYSHHNNSIIDELVGEVIYLNNEKIIILGENNLKPPILFANDINKINIQLLTGDYSEPYWLNCLINTIGINLFTVGHRATLGDCIEEAKFAYNSKIASSLLNKIVRSIR